MGGSSDSAALRILVGVDGSMDGLRAVAYAMREAKVAGSDLWLVHVADDAAPVGVLWDLVATPEELRRAGLSTIQEALDHVHRAGFPASRVKSEVVVGRPAQVLAELSRDARLMVVGRRSISGMERMFVGSTSVAVASSAHCPVIVISAASTPHQTGGLGTVAVAVSTWPPHSSALEWGVREADVRHARLRVVHIVPEAAGLGRQQLAGAMAELEQQTAPLRREHPETQVDTEVMVGNPIDELVSVSGTVDLLIVGLPSPGAPLSGLMRGLLAHSHCPVGMSR